MPIKIAFVSPHCLLDYTNGAATATRDGLRMLVEQGFECQAFCGTRLDEPQEGLLQESLFRRGVRYEVHNANIGPYQGRLLFTVDGNLPVTVFENVSTRGGWLNVQEAEAFLTGVDIFLRKNRPDVVVTYGGDPVSIAAQRLAKRLGITIVFELHNFAYSDRSAFEAVDYVTVPSEFSRRYYRQRLGLDCHVLPNIVNWKAAEVRGERGRKGEGEKGSKSPHPNPLPEGEGTMSPNPLPEGEGTTGGRKSDLTADLRPQTSDFVTFINPHVVKGVYVFARIARELARRRPDIPILVTQGRSRADALNAPELGLRPHLAGPLPAGPAANPPCDGRNIFMMPFTPDPRAFYPTVYSMTRLLLMPSLWNESFGLVAAEAMLNGIPVLASNRGALTETVGGSPHPNPLPEGEGTKGILPEGERTEGPLPAAGGFLFDIPARYTPETREVPTAQEVEPWVETIIRLWDDAAEYVRWSRAARERAQLWHPDRLAPIYRDFFSRTTHQPGPPLVPQGQSGVR